MRRPSSLVKMSSGGLSSTGVSGGVTSAWSLGKRVGCLWAAGLFLVLGASGRSFLFLEGVPGRVK